MRERKGSEQGKVGLDGGKEEVQHVGLCCGRVEVRTVRVLRGLFRCERKYLVDIF